MNVYEELRAVNVNDHTEKKNNLTYLSWAWAWDEVMRRYPGAEYEIKEFDGKPYLYDKTLGYLVMTSMTIDGITRTMWLPVMDGANKAMRDEPYTYQVKEYVDRKWTGKYVDKTVEVASMFDINRLGLYIYSGEDLPPELPKTLTKAQVSTLESCIPKHGQTIEKVCDTFKVKNLSKLTVDQFMWLMDRMGEK